MDGIRSDNMNLKDKMNVTVNVTFSKRQDFDEFLSTSSREGKENMCKCFVTNANRICWDITNFTLIGHQNKSFEAHVQFMHVLVDFSDFYQVSMCFVSFRNCFLDNFGPAYLTQNNMYRGFLLLMRHENVFVLTCI